MIQVLKSSVYNLQLFYPQKVSEYNSGMASQGVKVPMVGGQQACREDGLS